jgi:hypothetical protein
MEPRYLFTRALPGKTRRTSFPSFRVETELSLILDKKENASIKHFFRTTYLFIALGCPIKWLKF